MVLGTRVGLLEGVGLRFVTLFISSLPSVLVDLCSYIFTNASGELLFWEGLCFFFPLLPRGVARRPKRRPGNASGAALLRSTVWLQVCRVRCSLMLSQRARLRACVLLIVHPVGLRESAVLATITWAVDELGAQGSCIRVFLRVLSLCRLNCPLRPVLGMWGDLEMPPVLHTDEPRCDERGPFLTH